MKTLAFIALLSLPLAAQAGKPSIGFTSSPYVGTWVDKDSYDQFNKPNGTDPCQRVVFDSQGDEPMLIAFEVKTDNTVDFLPPIPNLSQAAAKIDDKGVIQFTPEAEKLSLDTMKKTGDMPADITKLEVVYKFDSIANETSLMHTTVSTVGNEEHTGSFPADDHTMVRVSRQYMANLTTALGLCLTAKQK